MSPTKPSRRLLYKLLLPTVVAGLLLALVVHFYWLPARLDSVRSSFEQVQKEKLVVLEMALVGLLLSDDIVQVHRMLEQVEQDTPHWTALTLVDAKGRRLYPIDAQAAVAPDKRMVNMMSFDDALNYKDKALGRLQVTADPTAAIQEESAQLRSAERWLFLLLVMTAGLIGWLQNRMVMRPLQQLAVAAKRLAANDFSAELPQASQDEMGYLVTSFGAMRESRRLAETEVQILNASLEERVQQRTEELHEARSQLLQSEKMASIGQLAAGVAHEINNPIGYVYSNLGSLEKYVQDVFSMIDSYEQAESAIADSAVRTRLQATREKLDLAFLKEDLRALMAESKEGITRVKNIVQNLKDFSHVDASDEWHYANLHTGINSTLNIVNNEIKYKAEVIKEYGDLPEVECLASQLNQVFMNLLVNASHAIEERGTITIRTGTEGEQVWVEIEDSGKGIAPENLTRIFDPFFTTKPVGTGTGLGLSLSYGIVQKHHGKLEVSSEVGKGTRFRVWLPIRQQEQLEMESQSDA